LRFILDYFCGLFPYLGLAGSKSKHFHATQTFTLWIGCAQLANVELIQSRWWDGRKNPSSRRLLKMTIPQTVRTGPHSQRVQYLHGSLQLKNPITQLYPMGLAMLSTIPTHLTCLAVLQASRCTNASKTVAPKLITNHITSLPIPHLYPTLKLTIPCSMPEYRMTRKFSTSSLTSLSCNGDADITESNLIFCEATAAKFAYVR
jgi:hypothetical protein